MTAYSELQEVQDALRAWGETGTADMVQKAMTEFAVWVDRAVVAEQALERIVSILSDEGLARRVQG